MDFILPSQTHYNPKLGYINFWVSLIREVGCWLVEPFCLYDGCLCITSAWGVPFGLCGVFLLGDFVGQLLLNGGWMVAPTL
jgi:hypothetical protein